MKHCRMSSSVALLSRRAWMMRAKMRDSSARALQPMQDASGARNYLKTAVGLQHASLRVALCKQGRSHAKDDPCCGTHSKP